MEYAVTDTEDVPITDLEETDEMPPDLDIRSVGETLGTENLAINVWYFEEGEEVQYHAHATQEEFYYVLDGTFSLKLGRSGETEIVEATEESMWVAKPMIGHGHRCVSEGGGTLLAIGAPAVEDPGLDPHGLDEDDIDEALDT